MDRKKNRSDSYQSMFAEQPYSNEMMADFSDSQGMCAKLDGREYEYNEEYLDLKEKLYIEYWRLIDTELTERQREVLHLSAEGSTQIEIAKELGVNQSSITKSINGNCDYRNKNGRVVYGGCKKKLRILAQDDEKIQEILLKMVKLVAEMEGKE